MPAGQTKLLSVQLALVLVIVRIRVPGVSEGGEEGDERRTGVLAMVGASRRHNETVGLETDGHDRAGRRAERKRT